MDRRFAEWQAGERHSMRLFEPWRVESPLREALRAVPHHLGHKWQRVGPTPAVPARRGV